MTRAPMSGKAAAVSTEDFNERVKRLLAGKPDPRKAEERRTGAPRGPKPGPKP